MPVPSAVIRVTISWLEHLVEAGLLDVEDLAAQRQDRLELAVAALLGRAAGGVALDDVDFAQGRVLFLAVGELAGQADAVEHALAAGHVARLARGLAGARGFDDLAVMILASSGLFQQVVGRASAATTSSTPGAPSEETSFILVCEANFGSGIFTDRRRPGPRACRRR
jgi:hypothetical protein